MLSEEACQAKECQQPCVVWGSGQLITATTLSGFGVIPAAETVTPLKTAVDWNSLHLAGVSNSPLSWHFLKNFHIFASFVMKSSSAMPMSSIQITNSSLIMSSNAVAIILKNVVG